MAASSAPCSSATEPNGRCAYAARATHGECSNRSPSAATNAASSIASRSSRVSTAVDSPTMCSGRTGTRVSVAPGRRAERGGHGGRGRDVGRLPHALEAVRRLGVGVLEDARPHGRHVEHGGQQVVGERRVEDLAVARPGSPPSAPGRAPGRCRPRSGPRAPAGSSPARRPGSWRARRPAPGRARRRRRRRRGGPRRRTAGARRPGRSRRAGRSAVVALDRLLDDVVAEDLGEAVADGVERPRLGRPALGCQRERALADRLARGLHRPAASRTSGARRSSSRPSRRACRRAAPRRARPRARSGRSAPAPSRRPGRPRRRRCGPRRAARRRRSTAARARSSSRRSPRRTRCS